MSNGRLLGLMWSALVGAMVFGSPTVADELRILAPRSHEVIQRVGFQPGQAPGGNFAPGPADVAIEVDVPVPIDRTTAVARVVPIEGPPAVAEPVWTRVDLVPGAKAGLHVGRLLVPARGWFRLDIRIVRADGAPPLTASVEPVGVG